MRKQVQHVVDEPGEDATAGAGKDRTTIVHFQADAIRRRREIAMKNGQLALHGRDGQIREKNTYGNDKFPPRG